MCRNICLTYAKLGGSGFDTSGILCSLARMTPSVHNASKFDSASGVGTTITSISIGTGTILPRPGLGLGYRYRQYRWAIMSRYSI